jgi:hypothetical protein
VLQVLDASKLVEKAFQVQHACNAVLFVQLLSGAWAAQWQDR